MNTSDVEQAKLVVLTPLGNKQSAFDGARVEQNIKVFARGVETNMPVERTLGNEGACFVWGDPHVSTFDSYAESNSKYEFWLVIPFDKINFLEQAWVPPHYSKRALQHSIQDV
jgi:hypothetical protein